MSVSVVICKLFVTRRFTGFYVFFMCLAELKHDFLEDSVTLSTLIHHKVSSHMFGEVPAIVTSELTSIM